MENTQALDAFSATVGDYLALIAARSSLSAQELLAQAEPLLVRLYSQIIQIPIVFPEDYRPDDPASDDAQPALLRSLTMQLGSCDLYRAVFDPYEAPSEATVTGSLADDLADIHADLARGQARWKSGDVDEAVFEWRFGFDSHWGRHLTSALHALYALQYEHAWTVSPLAERRA